MNLEKIAVQQVNYQQIESLVTNTKQQGNSLQITFTCSVTGQSVEATGRMQRSSNPGAGALVRQSLVRNLMWSLRRWIYRLMGRGMGARIAGDLISQTARGAANRAQFTRADRQDAIVRAFGTVQDQFVWDNHTDHWIHRSAPAELIGAE